jgi:phospholipase C
MLARFLVFVLLSVSAFAQGTITHVILINKENRSTDEMFGTFPGVQNYCKGGNSPNRCTNNQATSCTTVGTHDVCGNGGFCEPLICTTPSGPECTAGDTCPQITQGLLNGVTTNLTLQSASATITPDVPHSQVDFINEFGNGAMNWPSNRSAGMAYFDSTKIPYYYLLASTYGLEDNHFSTMGGPSQPNHAYMFAASSGEWSDNPTSTGSGAGSPGNIPGISSGWYCGALHTGSSAPYTYSGTEISTQASDGTQYYAGVCRFHRTVSCSCKCPTGTKCPNTFINGGTPCSTDAACTALSDTCSTSNSIGGTQGAPCLQLTTIADRIEAVLGTGSTSWGYYSQNNTGWLAPAYFQSIYFDSTRWNNHLHQDTDFDAAVSNCTGMCSNNHATACTTDAQCGAGHCIDSDGTPAGSQACTLPAVSWISATTNANSEHPAISSMLAGQTWTQNRLTPYFSSAYVYNHSIVLITWDDWGGFYDHVPPPVQDGVPTLGFRVPLICVGPYCKNKVTHTQMEFASALKGIEGIFGLSSINARDAAAIDAFAGTGTLSSNTDGMVNTNQTPIPAIGASTFNSTTLSNVTLQNITAQ